MKRILLGVFVFTSVSCLAQSGLTAKQEILLNHYFSASNYLDYDNQLTSDQLTPTPKGYEPYYFSHYGRHGSRWLIGENDYNAPLTTLNQAKEQGKLTEEGLRVLNIVEAIVKTSENRRGELTVVGERQHHGIGRRMAQHFPDLFKTPGLPIDARSTVVIRCILSMEAECEELMAANPSARIHNDVSESLQYYLNQPWPRKLREASACVNQLRNKYKVELTHTERLTNILFNDQGWVKDNVRAGSFVRSLFKLAANMQSHDYDLELYSIFNDEEIYDLWRQSNIGWYLNYGAAPQNGGIMPFSQSNLLRNIIETADTVTTKQATLRFGHEVCVMPLACLMELGQCGAQVENLDTLENVWRNYRIFPMACNIQLIFYRPKKGKSGDILVKALLNEREMTMPVDTDKFPYYRWSLLRDYYLKKLDSVDL